MALSWTCVIKLIRKLIRCIILDKIKRVLFGGTSWLIENIPTKLLFYMKGSGADHLFVSFF